MTLGAREFPVVVCYLILLEAQLRWSFYLRVDCCTWDVTCVKGVPIQPLFLLLLRSRYTPYHPSAEQLLSPVLSEAQFLSHLARLRPCHTSRPPTAILGTSLYRHGSTLSAPLPRGSKLEPLGGIEFRLLTYFSWYTLFTYFKTRSSSLQRNSSSSLVIQWPSDALVSNFLTPQNAQFNTQHHPIEVYLRHANH